MDKEKLNNEDVEAVEEVTAEEIVEEIPEEAIEVVEETAETIEEITEEPTKEVDEDVSMSNNITPVEDSTEIKKSLSKNAIIGIIAGGVVVIVLLIFAIFSIFGNMSFSVKTSEKVVEKTTEETTEKGDSEKVVEKNTEETTKKGDKVQYNDSYNKMYVDVEGKTLGELADEAGYSVEEYKKINGLPADMGPDTNTNAVNNSVPVREVVKKSDKEFSEFKAYYGWGDSVTEDSTVGEALGETKLRVILGVASLDEETAAKTLQEFKAYYGFGDEVTLDTLYKDVRTKIDTVAAEERKKKEAETVATPAPEQEKTEE